MKSGSISTLLAFCNQSLLPRPEWYDPRIIKTLNHLNGHHPHLVEPHIFINLNSFDRARGKRRGLWMQLLKVERSILDAEESLPDRLGLVLSPDRLSVRPKLSLDPSGALMCYAIWQRLSVVRLRVHRPFLFPKEGVSESEHKRHIHALEFICRRHLLICGHLPHVMMMHPLVLYSYINTALSCGIALLLYPDMLDASFFISELHKLLDIFSTAQKTISSSLASSASTVISYMIERAQLKDPRAPPPHKLASGPSFHATPRSSPHFTDTEDLRRKSPLRANSVLQERSSSGTRGKSNEQHQRPIIRFPALERDSEKTMPQLDGSPDAGFLPVSDNEPPYSSGESPDLPIINLSAMAEIPFFTFRCPSPLPNITSGTQPSSPRSSASYGQNLEEQSALSNVFDPHFLKLFGLTSATSQSSTAGTSRDYNTTHLPGRASQVSYHTSDKASNYGLHESRDRIQSLEGSSGGNSVHMISPSMTSGPMTPFASPPTQFGIHHNSKQPSNFESHDKRGQIKSLGGSRRGISGNTISPPTNSSPMTPLTSPSTQVEIDPNSNEASDDISHKGSDRIRSLEGSSGASPVNTISPPMNSGPITPFTSPSTQVEINDERSGVGGEQLFWNFIRGEN
ncbi:hypothetical protein DFH28DRAFT_192610 [Melampsora americana]|nr:hypothetical protein DFH28DRAFT_192610 [Melampsora americana]